MMIVISIAVAIFIAGGHLMAFAQESHSTTAHRVSIIKHLHSKCHYARWCTVLIMVALVLAMV